MVVIILLNQLQFTKSKKVNIIYEKKKQSKTS